MSQKDKFTSRVADFVFGGDIKYAPGYPPRLDKEALKKSLLIKILDRVESGPKNCGTGSGGFKPGNQCARGGGLPMASDAIIDRIEAIKNSDRDRSGVLKTPEKVESVPMSSLVGTQKQRSDKVVEDYRQRIRRGESIDSGKDGGVVAGVRVGGKVYLEDGHHRAEAMLLEGITKIDVAVRDYSQHKIQ